jgi:hypothetical protein
VTDDRELRDDRGQHCAKCDTNFKYQYLYDDHVPCKRGDEGLQKDAQEDFEKGYDQAVREIRDHFAKVGDHGVVHVIESIWKIVFEKKARTS